MKKISFEELPEAVGLMLEKLDHLERIFRSTNQPIEIQKEKLLSIEEAAEFLNLKVPTIYSKVSRGELPVMKRSKRLYFSRKELMNYLKEGARKSYSDIQNEAENYLNKKGKS
jgi:excisionase family DNA binding protein